jgi:hypothetical protein
MTLYRGDIAFGRVETVLGNHHFVPIWLKSGITSLKDQPSTQIPWQNTTLSRCRDESLTSRAFLSLPEVLRQFYFGTHSDDRLFGSYRGAGVHARGAAGRQPHGKHSNDG